MGTIALLSLAVGAASTIAQTVQARKASKARRESQAVQTASQNVKDRLARRRSAREERVRRARLIQASTTAGTSGSSGEVGASSAIGSNFAASVANQSGQKTAADGISAANQRVADAQSRANSIAAFSGLAKQGLGMWDDYRKGLI